MASHRRSYREHLRATVASSAAPYGYTLTIWTSGAVTTHGHGIPSAWEALLLLVGAAAGFGLAAAIAHGGPQATFSSDTERSGVRIWGGFHLFSVGFSIGLAAAASAVLSEPIVWLVVGFVSTTVYLIVTAGQFTVAERREETS